MISLEPRRADNRHARPNEMELAKAVEKFPEDAPEGHRFGTTRFGTFEEISFADLGGYVRGDFDFGLRVRYRHPGDFRLHQTTRQPPSRLRFRRRRNLKRLR